MSDQTRQYLESILDAGQLEAAFAVLGSENAWGSLGPRAPGARPHPLPEMPATNVTLTLPDPDHGHGSGTREAPWVHLLGDFLAQYPFDPPNLPAYKSHPPREKISAYLSELACRPFTLKVPAGHYLERSFVVPPGVRLLAAGKVFVYPDPQTVSNTPLIRLEIAAGLLGFTLDGSAAAEFVPSPSRRITAISAAHDALIVSNHIRHFTGHAIVASGNRGRDGSGVIVHDNIIEWIGFSGIRGQSLWDIRDNRIRYAGVLRPTGGGGDDGIIPAWGAGGVIANNLVILARRPHGRHVISGQAPSGCLVAGNIAVAEGGLRNTIGFSDGAHGNRFVGNLAIGTGPSASRIQAGISATGNGNIVEHNAVFGNPRGFRTRGSQAGNAPKNLIRFNYAEYTRSGIHRSSHYEAHDNTLIRNTAPLPGGDPDGAGLFDGMEPGGRRDRQPLAPANG